MQPMESMVDPYFSSVSFFYPPTEEIQRGGHWPLPYQELLRYMLQETDSRMVPGLPMMSLLAPQGNPPQENSYQAQGPLPGPEPQMNQHNYQLQVQQPPMGGMVQQNFYKMPPAGPTAQVKPAQENSAQAEGPHLDQKRQMYQPTAQVQVQQQHPRMGSMAIPEVQDGEGFWSARFWASQIGDNGNCAQRTEQDHQQTLLLPRLLNAPSTTASSMATPCMSAAGVGEQNTTVASSSEDSLATISDLEAVMFDDILGGALCTQSTAALNLATCLSDMYREHPMARRNSCDSS